MKHEILIRRNCYDIFRLVSTFASLRDATDFITGYRRGIGTNYELIIKIISRSEN